MKRIICSFLFVLIGVGLLGGAVVIIKWVFSLGFFEFLGNCLWFIPAVIFCICIGVSFLYGGIKIGIGREEYDTGWGEGGWGGGPTSIIYHYDSKGNCTGWSEKR